MKNDRNKYFVKNTVIFAIGNLGTRLISFFLVPIYTYVLTTEDYGTADLVFTLCSILTPIVMCNIGEGIKRYSLDKNNDNYEILTTAFIWVGIGILLTSILSPLFRFYEPVHDYVFLMYLYILAYSTNLVFVEYLRGKEKFVSYTICSIVTSLVIAVLNILFLVILKAGITGYFWSYIIAYTLSLIFAFVLGKPYQVTGHWKFNLNLFKQISMFSIMLVPNSLMWWVINSSDRIMVSSMVSTSANGLLTVAYKIPSLITTLSSIVMQAWQYSAIRERESIDKVEYNNRMFDAYVRLTILIAAGLIIIVKPMLRFYVSKEFFSAWRYSPFLIIGCVFLTLATFVGTTYYVEKDMKGNLKSAIVGATINIVLNIILISRLGVLGATIASCISYLSILVYRFYDTRKYMKLKLESQHCISFILLFAILATSYIEGNVRYVLFCLEMLCLLVLNRKLLFLLFRRSR